MSKMSVAMTAMWADPVKRAALIAKRNASPGNTNPERGRKISEKAKLRWADPEFKARVSAAVAKALRGRVGSPHSTPVTIDGVQYPSIAEAARKTGLARSTILKANKQPQIAADELVTDGLTATTISVRQIAV